MTRTTAVPFWHDASSHRLFDRIAPLAWSPSMKWLLNSLSIFSSGHQPSARRFMQEIYLGVLVHVP